MFPDFIKKISKRHHLEIIEFLNKRGGASISEIANFFEMSYMGIKQICMQLEKNRFIKFKKEEREGGGRPSKIYYTTEECLLLFSYQKSEILSHLLESASDIYGPEVREKIIWNFYKKVRIRLIERISKFSTLSEKIQQITLFRNEIGYQSAWSYLPEKSEYRLIDFYHPLYSLLNEMPFIQKREVETLRYLIKIPVESKQTYQGFTFSIQAGEES